MDDGSDGKDVTEYDLTARQSANAFSFFDRGDNRNAVIYADKNTVLGMSENTYNVAVPIYDDSEESPAKTERSFVLRVLILGRVSLITGKAKPWYGKMNRTHGLTITPGERLSIQYGTDSAGTENSSARPPMAPARGTRSSCLSR